MYSVVSYDNRDPVNSARLPQGGAKIRKISKSLKLRELLREKPYTRSKLIELLGFKKSNERSLDSYISRLRDAKLIKNIPIETMREIYPNEVKFTDKVAYADIEFEPLTVGIESKLRDIWCEILQRSFSGEIDLDKITSDDIRRAVAYRVGKDLNDSDFKKMYPLVMKKVLDKTGNNITKIRRWAFNRL